jgi:hypothetical protein
MSVLPGVQCPACGIRIQTNALGSHCRSRTCQQNKAAAALIKRGFISAGTTWATLQKVGIETARGTGGRLFAPEWAVRLAAALAPLPIMDQERHLKNYDELRRNRHDIIARLSAADCADMRDAIVATWALGGNKAVDRLVRGLAQERGWKWPK